WNGLKTLIRQTSRFVQEIRPFQVVCHAFRIPTVTNARKVRVTSPMSKQRIPVVLLHEFPKKETGNSRFLARAFKAVLVELAGILDTVFSPTLLRGEHVIDDKKDFR